VGLSGEKQTQFYLAPRFILGVEKTKPICSFRVLRAEYRELEVEKTKPILAGEN
jgi:hypothetical protein